jgi:hypothetical protein
MEEREIRYSCDPRRTVKRLVRVEVSVPSKHLELQKRPTELAEYELFCSTDILHRNTERENDAMNNFIMHTRDHGKNCDVKYNHMQQRLGSMLQVIKVFMYE